MRRKWEFQGMKACCSKECARLRQRGPLNSAWKGGRQIESNGYVRVWMPSHPRADKNGTVLEHLLVAQAALGYPVPARHPVHHFDENKSNNERSNLVICQDNRYHMLLHARKRILDAGGDPDKVKICGVCKQLVQREEFHKNRATIDGLNQNCKPCQKRLANNRYAEKRKADA
jgi:hypothetical protein